MLGEVLAGPFAAWCLVLLLAGLAKLRAPGPFAQAVRTAGIALPPGRAHGAARGVGAAEIVLAALGLLAGIVGAALVALASLVMAGFLVRLRHRDGSAACGCFGASSAPAGRLHVLVNLLAAAVATAVAATGGIAVPDAAVDRLLGALLAGLLAWLVLVLLGTAVGPRAAAGGGRPTR